MYRDRPMGLIPLGVDAEAFRPDAEAGRAVRRALGWEDEGPPVVGFLGRFTRAKGVGVLMRALDLMAEMAVEWRALFVGAGPMEGEMRAWAARHGDRARVCTDIRHDEVPRYLNAMHVLAAPSQTTPNWREQFGRMLIEAFACGVSVVGSDSGEVPHVIAGAGIVVPEADVAAWARELAALLESPHRRAEVSVLGLERARTIYAWPVVARQYLNFFEQILASSAVQRSNEE
jgi:glycosyltransferase involved in cell wall biosynthesis